MTTTTTADRIIAYLTYVVGRDDGWLPTAREIADGISVKPSTVTTALRRLEYLGKVRPAGEAFGGGRTWTLIDTEGR